MNKYLGIKPLPLQPTSFKEALGYEPCARPGHNIITHCIEEKGHEGCHTYSPVPDDAVNMSDRLEPVMRMLTETCPSYRVGDFVTPRAKCCPFHDAAKTVMDAQEVLRAMRR